jgi:hypothetical protein
MTWCWLDIHKWGPWFDPSMENAPGWHPSFKVEFYARHTCQVCGRIGFVRKLMSPEDARARGAKTYAEIWRERGAP